MSTVHKTKDYAKFSFLPYNREINKSHVDQLMLAIGISNKLPTKAITVTKDFKIIDGQHRYLAARQLGLEIYYQIDENYTKNDIVMLNTTQSNWKLDDYLNFWSAQGKEDYKKLHEFCYDNNLPISLAMEWLNQSDHKHKFKNGLYTFSISEKSREALECTLELMEYMKEHRFRPKSAYRSKYFHRACKYFFFHPRVVPKIFFDTKLPGAYFKIQYENTKGGWIKQLVNVYNWKSQNPVGMQIDGSEVLIV